MTPGGLLCGGGKGPGWDIPQITDLHRGNTQIQPHFLGMSPTYGFYIIKHEINLTWTYVKHSKKIHIVFGGELIFMNIVPLGKEEC
jgi:hypothetical protein